ncbi:MAG TPA: pectate lyase, partial [Ruminococcaceae bacterium]|nr:pectate lyase [Oscillospiraceae bacterium]
AAPFFSDNFESGSGNWTATNGTWSVVNDGSAVYYKSGTNEGRAYRGDMTWTNYSVQADVKIDNFNGSNRAMVCARYKDGNNYYAVSLYNKNGGTIEIRKKVSGSSSTIAEASAPLAAGTWYTVKIEVNGSTIKAYLNGVEKLSATDTALTAGAVGLVPYKVAAKYDNIIVSQIGSTSSSSTTSSSSSGSSGSSSSSSSSSSSQPTVSDAIYVSPSGSASAQGTISNPTTLQSAITRVAAGGTIYMRAGTYSYNSQITIAAGNNGSSGSPKTIQNYNGERVILDFSSQPYGNPSSVSNPRGLQIDANYWYIKGLEIKGSADNGMFIGGSNNKIELCQFYENRDSGLQISRSLTSYSNISQWPSNNIILNCTSYNNADPDNGEDADGFACKLTAGTGNQFIGCISYNNVDDGWDLYTKSETGAIGPVYFKDCVAFNNGMTTSGTYTANSDGNGFKLGGDGIAVQHTLENCVAFNNKNHGFTDNSNPGKITLKNCTSYNNARQNGGKSNFDFARSSSSNNSFTNLLSFNTGGVSSDKYKGTAAYCIFYYSSKWYQFTSAASCDSSQSSLRGTQITAPDASNFVSLTPPTGNPHIVMRNASGGVTLGNFLKLTSSSPLRTQGQNGSYLGASLG